MSNVATEEERVMMLKVWWQKNRTWLMSVLVVAIVGFFGVRYYHSEKAKTAEHASVLFNEFFAAVVEGNQESSAELATQIQKEYPRTPYANTAALFQAHSAVVSNDLDTASERLTWLIEKSEAKFAKDIARVRLAQIKMAQGDNEGALKLLDFTPEDAYRPLFHEVKGDVLVALQRYSDARTAYDAALQEYTELGFQAHLLQFKFDELPQT